MCCSEGGYVTIFRKKGGEKPSFSIDLHPTTLLITHHDRYGDHGPEGVVTFVGEKGGVPWPSSSFPASLLRK